MTVIDLERGAPVSAPEAPLSLALGSFDGVHLGHRALIAAALDEARASGFASAVWSFTENPFGTPALMSVQEKLAVFAAMGIKYAVLCPFGEVSALTPREFAAKVLRGRLNARVLVCGFNYRFGSGALGDAQALSLLAAEYGARCRIIEAVCDGGGVVSSSRIREALAGGHPEEAAAMLGRPYSFTYPVTHGNEIGRTIGFPTINQPYPNTRAPLLRGVYACTCLGCPGVTNVGLAPTVRQGGGIICETHIIGYRGDLYDREVTVGFLRYMRPEKKFPSLEALKEQLALDVEEASRQ